MVFKAFLYCQSVLVKQVHQFSQYNKFQSQINRESILRIF